MRWEGLRKGDIIDIVAPGFPAKREELVAGMRRLEEWGLVPRFSEEIFGRHLICSSDEKSRFAQLKSALQAGDSKAVWFLRGGYGSLHLLPYLKKMKAPVNPKLLVGLSDITSLHLFFNQTWNWPTVHGPLLYFLGNPESSRSSIREVKQLIFGEKAEIVFDRLRPLNVAAEKARVIKGKVTGGNLTVAASHIGTPFQASTKNKILFFEDVGERAYRIDRMLCQWEMAGLFKGVKAVVFGQFVGGQDPDGKNRIKQLLKEFAEKMKLPVLSGVPCGHDKVQRPVPFNAPAVLITGRQSKLVCQSGGRFKSS